MENTKDDIEYKKKYIFENIEKIENHSNYLDIIKYYNCPYTKNSNGIFLNLNTIDHTVICDLFYKLKNELEDNTINETIIEKKIIEEEINNLFEVKVVKPETYDIIKIELFSNYEKEIIELSKKYKI